MAVNKNFVVKNGFEVNNNLIYADANTNKVGIGSTGPRTTLDVRGGIAVTDINAVGIVTIGDRFYVGNNGTVFTALGIGGSVGVGTNLPGYLLDVRSPVSTGQTAFYVRGDGRFTGNLSIQGDLSVDDITLDQADLVYLNVTGFGTAASLFVPGTASIKTGIVTNISGQNLNYSGFSTVTNLNVNGTFDSYAADSVFHGNVTINGNVTIGGTSSILNAVELRIEDKDIVLGFTTSQPPTDDTANHGGIAIASTEGAPLVSLQVAGINTLPDTYKQIMWVKRDTMGAGTTDAFLFNYGVGIGSTQVPDGVRLSVGEIQLTDNSISADSINLGIVQISSGIITATSGIVTYYGDGAYLQNISAGIGIGTTGGLVGYGVTFINFYGPGISTIFYDNSTGIATAFFQGGGSAGSVSIGTSPPSLPKGGDLWYSVNYGRTFVYYDEVALGIGSTAVWVDAAPFNVGIITASLQSLPAGTALSPSLAFLSDPSTGLYSPSAGHQEFVSAGNPILNINPSGINVAGVVTATIFNGNINATNVNATGVVTATTFRGSAQVGVATGGTYIGLTTQFNFVGSGITITPDYDVTSGITTLTFSAVSQSSTTGAVSDGIVFNSGITSVSSATLISTGSTVLTMPSTAGKEYIIYSINASNVAAGNTDVNVIGAFDFNGGERSYFAYNIPIPTGTSVELLRQPQVLNPSDRITMRATDYNRLGLDNGVQVYISYQEKTSTSYFGVGFGTVGLAVTTPVGVYTSSGSPSVLQSIRLVNRSDSGGYPISVLVTSGVTTTYLIDDLIVPKYASVEILETPKTVPTNAVVSVILDQAQTIDVQISGIKV